MNYRVSIVSAADKPNEFKTLYEAMFCMLMGIMSTRTTTNYLGDIKKAMTAVRKIFDIIENDSYKVKDNGNIVLSEIGDIEFKNVEFG